MANRKKQPADTAEVRARLVRTAAELSRLRSPCDFCLPDLEVHSYFGGEMLLIDLHHEPGCQGPRPGPGLIEGLELGEEEERLGRERLQADAEHRAAVEAAR